jgi:hypothetical protein
MVLSMCETHSGSMKRAEFVLVESVIIIYFQPINCLISSGGHLTCAKLRHLLMLCKNLRVTSSPITCPLSLSWSFSRALRSWIPTMVTPIGHAALPILNRKYPSFASTYLLSWAALTISTIGSRTPSSRSPFSNFLNSC